MGLEFESPAGHQKAAERLLFCVPDGDSKTCNATVRWTVARATDAGLLASKAFGNLPDCKQHCAPERDPSIFAVQKCKRLQAGHQKAAERLLFCVPDGDSKTCNATVWWTVARATDAGLLASKAFGNLPDCKQRCAPERDSNIFAVQKCKRSQACRQTSSEINRFPNFFFYLWLGNVHVLKQHFPLASNPLVTSSGAPKSSREAAFLRARWRFEDLQCDSPVDCRSRDRCRIACIKSIWQFAGLQPALRPRARLQYFCSAKMQSNASGSPKSSREAAFLRA